MKLLRQMLDSNHLWALGIQTSLDSGRCISCFLKILYNILNVSLQKYNPNAKFLVTFPIFQNQKVLGLNPGSPVVKIHAFTARSPVSIPGWWTKIPQKRKRSPTRAVPFMLAEYLWNLRGDALVFCTSLRQTWAPRKNQSSEDNECPPSSNSNNTCYHLLRTYYVPGTMLSILFTVFHFVSTSLRR